MTRAEVRKGKRKAVDFQKRIKIGMLGEYGYLSLECKLGVCVFVKIGLILRGNKKEFIGLHFSQTKVGLLVYDKHKAVYL